MKASKILPASETAIAEAARLLAEGRLVGIPTETVYGLAADATNPDAVRQIFATKGRPENNPLIVHVESIDSALRYVQMDATDWLADRWKRATEFWPGPLTIVMPHGGKVIREVTAGSETVAIRVPSHPVMRSLLERCPFPIAAPSANRSNYVSPTRAEHVAESLGENVALVLDGGPCGWGLESTIIRPTATGVELLRPGGITAEDLKRVFGSVEMPAAKPDSGLGQGKAESVPMAAPGMLAKHYSPSKPLYQIGVSAPEPGCQSAVARITFSPLPPAEASAFGWYRTLSEHGDLREVAQNLFAALRDADASQCDLIIIDQCERSGIGQAIMDRIDRACR